MTECGEGVITYLDYHATMVVFGKYYFIISSSGRYTEVNAFTSDPKALHQFTIVNAAIAYNFPYTMETYFMVGCNILYVSLIEINLIPPFIYEKLDYNSKMLLKYM